MVSLKACRAEKLRNLARSLL